MELIWSSKTNHPDELKDLRVKLDIGKGIHIIAFADTRYWKGGHCGYRFVETGNLKDCLFTNHDDTEFFLTEKGEFLSREYGREGTCQYYFRRFKGCIPKYFLSLMCDAKKQGTFGNSFINYYTEPLGDIVRSLL